MNSDLYLSLSLDLSQSLLTQARHQRLLDNLLAHLPADAACLFLREEDELVPVATAGLVPETLGIRFKIAEHPRLQAICGSEGPKKFPADCGLPDPFDSLLSDSDLLVHNIHSCMGWPLRLDSHLVGVLTLDARDPQAFDKLAFDPMTILGALAAATLRVSQLIESLEHAVHRSDMIARDLVSDAFQRVGGEMIGVSQAIQETREQLEVAAQTDMTVLITGESGVGKELVARAIHSGSRRSQSPMIYVNCAALPEATAESELFGHARGAFTGADQRRLGKFRAAHRGTIFLDEIGELAPGLQAKLLRVLQSGEVQSLGQDTTEVVDVRVIAATNRDLPRAIEVGLFRADLYHRLNVLPIEVPGLKQRLSDIPVLIAHFTDIARRKLGLGMVRFHTEVMARLMRYDWPGNVRELENTIHRMLLRVLARHGRREQPIMVDLQMVESELTFLKAENPRPSSGFGADDSNSTKTAMLIDAPPDCTLAEGVADFKRRLILERVHQHGGNWSAAARSLGMHRSNLSHTARRLGIK